MGKGTAWSLVLRGSLKNCEALVILYSAGAFEMALAAGLNTAPLLTLKVVQLASCLPVAKSPK